MLIHVYLFGLGSRNQWLTIQKTKNAVALPNGVSGVVIKRR
jgi:hypothetical protein